MLTNLEVKIHRAASPTGLGSDSELELVESRVPTWMLFDRSTTITSEGYEVISDGSAKFSSTWDVREGDVLELQEDPTKKYRIESVQTIYSNAGSLVARRCQLVRDNSLE